MQLTPHDVERQSLAKGSAATALLHIERALSGTGGWATAHAHIKQVANGPIDGAPHAGLYYGAPAVAFVLHAASASRDARYQAAAHALDKHVARLAQRRLATAAERMGRRLPASFAEFDLFRGLAGIGGLLLLRAPGSDLLAEVLDYMIRLTKPRRIDGQELPGWWVDHDPDPLIPTPGGHVNLGLAHGAAGPLALLSLAALRGCEVPGQIDALHGLCHWFDRWRQSSAEGLWWPQWLTRDEMRTGRTTQQRQGWPSWCYGTAGIARALQLAALATRDPIHRGIAEKAMVECLTDQQLSKITGTGLCHGMAGVYQTAFRAAGDAANAAIGQRLPALAAALAQRAADGQDDPGGLPDGAAGVGLALETARQATPPRSGWDACLLIT
ncbi:lanthionine synthetase [Sphaerisporangium album]|uniref:Lanthionine synthetase n=1 Tax=Sphaerisporangium album TaxID=509200 RepID=A0A367FIB0_9ACTN|nr:lanthionine synthetase C family protein [Sphaerisporangium album]RCG29562.1 lanthionine synthetase [Sphaerisporangium album]